MSGVKEAYGLACPSCGSDAGIVIACVAEGMGYVSAGGVDHDVDHTGWCDDSHCDCRECGYRQTVAEFTVDNQPYEWCWVVQAWHKDKHILITTEMMRGKLLGAFEDDEDLIEQARVHMGMDYKIGHKVPVEYTLDGPYPLSGPASST